MNEIAQSFALAFNLLTSLDAGLIEIVLLSLKVSVIAITIGCLLGFTLAAALAVFSFPGKNFIIVLLHAFMGLPPVVVGLLVYLMLSRSGPLGVLGLLYTPTAMIIAQILLVTPLIAALAWQFLHDLHLEYDEFFRSLRLTGREKIAALIRDGRYGLATVALAGFGRAISEVGAVMIVGGNINHSTRIMTTAIALETSKGALALALALGLVLICLSIAVNAGVMGLRFLAREEQHG